MGIHIIHCSCLFHPDLPFPPKCGGVLLGIPTYEFKNIQTLNQWEFPIWCINMTHVNTTWAWHALRNVIKSGSGVTDSLSRVSTLWQKFLSWILISLFQLVWTEITVFLSFFFFRGGGGEGGRGGRGSTLLFIVCCLFWELVSDFIFILFSYTSPTELTQSLCKVISRKALLSLLLGRMCSTSSAFCSQLNWAIFFQMVFLRSFSLYLCIGLDLLVSSWCSISFSRFNRSLMSLSNVPFVRFIGDSLTSETPLQ